MDINWYTKLKAFLDSYLLRTIFTTFKLYKVGFCVEIVLKII